MVKRMGGKGKFAAEKIHSRKNLIELPSDIHKEVTRFYSSKHAELTGEGFNTVRDWMNTLSYEDQFKWGKKIRNHIWKGTKL